MVKKNTNEHDYFKNIKDFLTYHFNKTPGNETKLANVLEYCKLNGRVLGKMKQLTHATSNNKKSKIKNISARDNPNTRPFL